jgi:hypothetical protein
MRGVGGVVGAVRLVVDRGVRGVDRVVDGEVADALGVERGVVGVDRVGDGSTPDGTGTVISGSGKWVGSIAGSLIPTASRPEVATSSTAVGNSRSDTCSIPVAPISLLRSTSLGSRSVTLTATAPASAAIAMIAGAIESLGRE